MKKKEKKMMGGGRLGWKERWQTCSLMHYISSSPLSRQRGEWTRARQDTQRFKVGHHRGGQQRSAQFESVDGTQRRESLG